MALQFIAAAANVGSSVYGAISGYQSAKAKQKLLRRKAKAARQLGEYNATTTLNNTIGKVNELSSQGNIIAANKQKILDESAVKFSQMYEKMADEYATLVLKSRGNYSSYDYLKSVEKDVYEKAADMDYQISQGTYQAAVQQTEFARKSKLVYNLGLANAEIIKYKANLEAVGLETQGEIAKTEGYNQMIAGLGKAAGDFAGYSQDGTFSLS